VIERQLLPLLVQSVRELAAYLGVSPTELVVLPNATTGLNTAILGHALRAGDVVLSLDICYGAVKKMVAFACASARGAARHVELHVELPLYVMMARSLARLASLPAVDSCRRLHTVRTAS